MDLLPSALDLGLKWPTRPLFCLFISVFLNTNFTEKTVNVIRSQTGIVGVESEHADHLMCDRFCDLLDFGQLFKVFGNNSFDQISHSLRQFL